MPWVQLLTAPHPCLCHCNCPAQVDYQGKPITSVAWAPTLERPVELVAVAAGQRVLVWSLQGPADAMQVGRLDCAGGDALLLLRGLCRSACMPSCLWVQVG